MRVIIKVLSGINVSFEFLFQMDSKEIRQKVSLNWLYFSWQSQSSNVKIKRTGQMLVIMIGNNTNRYEASSSSFPEALLEIHLSKKQWRQVSLISDFSFLFLEREKTDETIMNHRTRLYTWHRRKDFNHNSLLSRQQIKKKVSQEKRREVSHATKQHEMTTTTRITKWQRNMKIWKELKKRKRINSVLETEQEKACKWKKVNRKGNSHE